MNRITLHVDGASRGNPGSSGIGAVITDARGKTVREISEYIGTTTNNVAEYTALIRGLEEALELGATSVQVNADSELLVRQVTGIYKVKAPHLRRFHELAVGLLSKFKEVKVTHVPRHLNADADKLATAGARMGDSKPESGTTETRAGQGKLRF
jgi:ribonuclease HI